MWLVDLNYNFKCDWPIEVSDNKLSNHKLSNNKLSDNNLASELVEKYEFFKPITIEEIVIFMIKKVIYIDLIRLAYKRSSCPYCSKPDKEKVVFWFEFCNSAVRFSVYLLAFCSGFT